jgi:hypothetical protein
MFKRALRLYCPRGAFLSLLKLNRVAVRQLYQAFILVRCCQALLVPLAAVCSCGCKVLQ